MDRILNFQLSMFGSFINIKPDNDITMKLMAHLQEDRFVPGTVNVAVVDAVSKKINSESRLQMVSENKFWNIVFLQERIDVNYTYLGGNEFYQDFESIFGRAINLLEKVFGVFPNTPGNRIAVNGKILINEKNANEREEFIKRFSVPLKVYGNSEIAEWNIRFNSKTFVNVSEDTVELCNNIIELGDIVGRENGKPKKRLLVTLDVNTLPENRNLRFTYKNLICLASNVKGMMENTMKEIEEG